MIKLRVQTTAVQRQDGQSDFGRQLKYMVKVKPMNFHCKQYECGSFSELYTRQLCYKCILQMGTPLFFDNKPICFIGKMM